MILIVNTGINFGTKGKILHRCDAWENGAYEKMRNWITENGFVIVDEDITAMGDMVMWVA